MGYALKDSDRSSLSLPATRLGWDPHHLSAGLLQSYLNMSPCLQYRQGIVALLPSHIRHCSRSQSSALFGNPLKATLYALARTRFCIQHDSTGLLEPGLSPAFSSPPSAVLLSTQKRRLTSPQTSQALSALSFLILFPLPDTSFFPGEAYMHLLRFKLNITHPMKIGWYFQAESQHMCPSLLSPQTYVLIQGPPYGYQRPLEVLEPGCVAVIHSGIKIRGKCLWKGRLVLSIQILPAFPPRGNLDDNFDK